MAAITQTKSFTDGEAGLSFVLVVGFFLCIVGAAGAQDTAFAFHAYLGAAASLAAFVGIMNRYIARDATPAPEEINGKPNYNLGPVKFAAGASMV